MAYVFGYMGVNPAHAGIIKGAWPEGGGASLVSALGASSCVVEELDVSGSGLGPYAGCGATVLMLVTCGRYLCAIQPWF